MDVHYMSKTIEMKLYHIFTINLSFFGSLSISLSLLSCQLRHTIYVVHIDSKVRQYEAFQNHYSSPIHILKEAYITFTHCTISQTLNVLANIDNIDREREREVCIVLLIVAYLGNVMYHITNIQREGRYSSTNMPIGDKCQLLHSIYLGSVMYHITYIQREGRYSSTSMPIGDNCQLLHSKWPSPSIT